MTEKKPVTVDELLKITLTYSSALGIPAQLIITNFYPLYINPLAQSPLMLQDILDIFQNRAYLPRRFIQL